MTLFIIGNGFDLNHGCETDYLSFKKYLFSHKYPIYDFDLSQYFLGVDKKMWTDFENELEFIDFKDEMDFFVENTNPNELSDKEFERAVSHNAIMQEDFEEAAENLPKALSTALSNFVCESTKRKITKKNYFSKIFKHGDIFITFNYTKLLEEIYCIDEKNINHIHGIAYPVYLDKDNVDFQYYDDSSIIFGHGNLSSSNNNEEYNYGYNPFEPHKCLSSLNKRLEKNYQMDTFINFLNPYRNKIDEVEIIGHNLGDVDKKYFDCLKTIIPATVKIKYWLFDENDEDEKRSFLKRFFTKNDIDIKYYPKNDSEKLHIIWDLDGTLIDSENEVMDALIRSVREVGLSENDQKAPFRVGPTIDKMLDNAFESDIFTPEIKSSIISAFRKNYDNCGFNHTPSFGGIEEILSDSRFVHHIVTNKPDLATARILEKLGWEKYFDSVITPYSFMKSADDKRKTKPELFDLCMADYPGEKFAGVGDMATDAKAALENKIPAIGVLWGTGTDSELRECGCTHIARSVDELKTILADYC